MGARVRPRGGGCQSCEPLEPCLDSAAFGALAMTMPATSTSTASPADGQKVTLRIRRQDGPAKEGRYEEFAVPLRANMNIISCLQWIAAHPVTTEGKATTPVVYDAGCLEEVCGA